MQWVPTDDGKGIRFNECEKFYRYVTWLKYMIANFLIPFGVKLSGVVTWKGEDEEDVGKITAKNNEVEVWANKPQRCAAFEY